MAYSLAVSYAGQALIDGFNFINTPDPTDGFVAYQNQQSALAYGYATVTSTNTVKLSVDSTNSYDPDGSLGGRPSVRIESKQPVNQGLVIGDFAHMPGSVCGTWPAFWLYGANWPDGGEIDIVEGANLAYTNLISGHTGEVCTLPSSGLYTGSQQYTNCTTDEDIGLVQGCNYAPPASDSSSYGDGFNAVGGGVYAMDWTTDAIRVWHFPRNKIPANIVSKQPDPSTWGAPQALFGGDPNSCDVGASFSNMNIVLNIDFCGDYAGGDQWGSSSCRFYASSCEIWVGNSPSQFANSYWEVNYIDVYSLGAASQSSSTPGLPATQPLPTSSDIASAASPTAPGSGSPSSEPSAVQPSTQPGESIPTPIATPPFPPSSANNSASAPIGTPPSGSAGSPGASGPTSEPAGSGPSGSFSGNPPAQSSPSVPAGSSGPSGGVSPTTSSASPIDSLVPVRDPATIGSFALLGCFASTTSFSTFNLSGNNGQMTPEVCVGLCPARTYAGVHDSMCYCADTLDAGTAAIPDRSRCNIPCPGNPIEFCGGNNLLAARDAPNSFLLTVYINFVGRPALPPPPAPGMGGSGGNVTQTIISTVTYTTVCSTNPALLVTQEYCTTLKVPKCAKCAAGKVTKPTVPMTAITQSCNKCGASGESVVTLTLPVGVAPGPKGGDLGQKPGSKPVGVGAPAPGGGNGTQPAPKPPAPGAPPVGPPVVPPVGGASPNGNGSPAPQPGAKVGNATVPAPTQQVGSTATVGLKPVQAGAERISTMSARVLFAVFLAGLVV